VHILITGKVRLPTAYLGRLKRLRLVKKRRNLDNMDLERERGITIKSHAIQMEYTYKDKNTSWTWLILRSRRFSYEVSRSIAACEGHFDCGCCAKYTGTNNFNLYLALENDLEIIPVLNKVDLQVPILRK
jgi:GTP-binding protein LepA